MLSSSSVVPNLTCNTMNKLEWLTFMIINRSFKCMSILKVSSVSLISALSLSPCVQITICGKLMDLLKDTFWQTSCDQLHGLHSSRNCIKRDIWQRISCIKVENLHCLGIIYEHLLIDPNQFYSGGLMYFACSATAWLVAECHARSVFYLAWFASSSMNRLACSNFSWLEATS